MDCAYLFHANERGSGSEVAVFPGNSLFAKALSCAISVVKANHVRDGATTNTFLFDCKLLEPCT